MDQDGEGEISSLARRILDLTEEGAGRADGEEGGSRFSTSGNGHEEQVGSAGSGEHAALRDSVRRALSGSR
jgi:vacuolar protein 8